MLTLLFKNLINNKWIAISLLVANILLIGTVASIPIYSNAAMYRMLSNAMGNAQIETGIYPGIMEVRYMFSGMGDQAVSVYEYTRDVRNREIESDFDIPMLGLVQNITTQTSAFLPLFQRETQPRRRNAILSSYSNIENHIELLNGEFITELIYDDEALVIPVIVSAVTLDFLGLLLNEVLVSQSLQAGGDYIRVKITGVFKEAHANDFYWVNPPSNLFNSFVISEGLMEQLFIKDYNSANRIEATWLHIFDYTQIDILRLEKYIEADRKYSDTLNVGSFSYRNRFAPIITRHMESSVSLLVMLLVLQTPIYILTMFFIYMLSRQILRLEENNISIMKSRGAGRGQIILLYFVKNLIIVLIAIPAGVYFGMFVCRVLGASNGFLEIVQRSALNVSLTPEAVYYSLAASAFSMIVMIFPVFGYSKVTIVNYKTAKYAGGKKPIWQMFYLDILAFGISLYGLYTFNQRSSSYILEAGGAAIDPLIFISSSLFIFGLGFIMLRVYPMLLRLLYMVGKKLWPPSIYASLASLARSRGEERFIMIFLVFTLAVGIFNAKAARTINLNSEDKIRYEAGADLVFTELWQSFYPNPEINEDGTIDTASSGDAIYIEPDFSKYSLLSGVESATRVNREYASVLLPSGSLHNVNVMGINTREFGNTAWWRDDLFATHFNNYLNIMAENPASVLLSRNFMDTYGYRVGDAIMFRLTGSGPIISSTIHGFTDYWPGFVNVFRSIGADGLMGENENWLIVANSHYLQSIVETGPYEVWLKAEGDSTSFFYDFVEEENLGFIEFTDTSQSIISAKNNPLLQGTNGVLTVGFITALLVCSAGFLLYFILSIKSRVLQFGVFRAMGLGFKSIIGILVSEQVFITGTAIAIGVAVGEVSSGLFVPIIQLAYTASEQTIPLKIITQPDDYIRLLTITGGMILLCMFVLGLIVKSIKMAQALKLGED